MIRPEIERDPNIKKLEQDVFARFQEIAKPLQPINSNNNAIMFVSFEDALKELAELKNK